MQRSPSPALEPFPDNSARCSGAFTSLNVVTLQLNRLRMGHLPPTRFSLGHPKAETIQLNRSKRRERSRGMNRRLTWPTGRERDERGTGDRPNPPAFPWLLSRLCLLEQWFSSLRLGSLQRRLAGLGIIQIISVGPVSIGLLENRLQVQAGFGVAVAQRNWGNRQARRQRDANGLALARLPGPGRLSHVELGVLAHNSERF